MPPNQNESRFLEVFLLAVKGNLIQSLPCLTDEEASSLAKSLSLTHTHTHISKKVKKKQKKTTLNHNISPSCISTVPQIQ